MPDGCAGRTGSRQGRLAPARRRSVWPRPTLARCWERGVVDAWGASCEGKPHPCPALFLVQDAGAWPRGLSLQPLHYSGRGCSPVSYGSSSRTMPIFFSSRRSSHGIVFYMHLGQGRPSKPISSTTHPLQQAALGGCLGKDKLPDAITQQI